LIGLVNLLSILKNLPEPFITISLSFNQTEKTAAAAAAAMEAVPLCGGLTYFWYPGGLCLLKS